MWQNVEKFKRGEYFCKALYVFFHKWINKLLLGEKRVPRTLSEAWKVAGSTTYKKVKQYDIVLSSEVSLFIQFIQSWKQGVFVYLVCSSRKESANEALCLLTNFLFPKTK